MEKIEETNTTNIDMQTIEKEEINNNENIQSENAESKNIEKEKFEIDESILADNEELEKVMEAIIYVEGNVPISRLRSLFKCENSDIRNHIENINNKYRNSKSAIEILEVGDSIMMTIIPSTFGTLSAIYDKKRKFQKRCSKLYQ